MKEEKKAKWYRKSRPIIGMAVISLLICGFFFPFLITGIAEATMPYQANGSLAHLLPNGRVVGSYLIDNSFTQPVFFQGRPSNASASTVDPDITLSQARNQVPRISNWTSIPQVNLMNLINSNTEGTFWILGSPYVNVLKLNLILIQDYPQIYQGYVVNP
jgi:potassium-transporting ATPase KdpC subunit